MKKPLWPLAASIAALAATAPGLALPGRAGQAAETPPDSHARAGDFQALQIATVDDKRLLREWAQPTPPNLTTNEATERNKPIYVFIVFSGCQADARGECDVVADFEVIDPKGRPYGKQVSTPLLKGKPAGSPAMLQLGNASMGLTVEDGEGLGVFRVRTKVTDRNARRSVVTEQSLAVTEAVAAG